MTPLTGTTSQTRVARSIPVVLANAAARALGRSRTSPRRLNVDELVARARRRTGLSDFGDEGLTERVAVLLESLRRESELTMMGGLIAHAHVMRLLVGRLRLEEERRGSPAIASETIRAPLFITGLPRSGTSLLHGLLSRDPAHRSPLVWETMLPCAVEGRTRGGRDPRIAVAARQLRWLNRLAPQFRAIHEVGAELPQECIDIKSHAFLSTVFETMYWVPSYVQWLERQDMRPAYGIHRRFLQHLQWQRPSARWVLKAPAHLFHLEALTDMYPDALIVHTHREPLEVLPSVASLLATLRSAFSDRVDPARIGREVTQRWWHGLQAAEAVRGDKTVGGDRIVDVRYRDVVDDPIGVVASIYTHFGMDFTAVARRRMEEHLLRFDRRRRPEHVYTLEMFEIDHDIEDRRYRAYRDRFGLDARP